MNTIQPSRPRSPYRSTVGAGKNVMHILTTMRDASLRPSRDLPASTTDDADSGGCKALNGINLTVDGNTEAEDTLDGTAVVLLTLQASRTATSYRTVRYK